MSFLELGLEETYEWLWSALLKSDSSKAEDLKLNLLCKTLPGVSPALD